MRRGRADSLLKKITDRLTSAAAQGRDARKPPGPSKTLSEAFAPPLKTPTGLSLTAVRPPHQMALLQPGYRPPTQIDSTWAQPPAGLHVRADIYNIINAIVWMLDPIDRGDVLNLAETLSRWFDALGCGQFSLGSLYDVCRQLDETGLKWRVECLLLAVRSVCIDKLKYNVALAPQREAVKAIDAALYDAQMYSSLLDAAGVNATALWQCMDNLEVTVFSPWSRKTASLGAHLSESELKKCVMQIVQSQQEVDAIVVHMQRQLRSHMVSALDTFDLATFMGDRGPAIRQTLKTEVQKAIVSWFYTAPSEARASLCNEVVDTLRVLTTAELLDNFHATCADMLVRLSEHPTVRAAALARRDNETFCKHIVALASTYKLCVQECYVRVGRMPLLQSAVQAGYRVLEKMVECANVAADNVALRAAARHLDVGVWERQTHALIDMTLFQGHPFCRLMNQNIKAALRQFQASLDLSAYTVHVVNLHHRFPQLAMARLYESGLYAVLDKAVQDPSIAQRALAVAECLLELAAVRSEQGLLYSVIVQACYDAAWQLAKRDVVSAIVLFERGLTYPLGPDTAVDRLAARERLADAITGAVNQNTLDWSYTTRSKLRDFATRLPRL